MRKKMEIKRITCSAPRISKKEKNAKKNWMKFKPTPKKFRNGPKTGTNAEKFKIWAKYRML
jgi:hypothetical protein